MNSTRLAPSSGAHLASPSVQQTEKRPVVSAQQMSDLLRRYPEVNDGERLELVDFLKRGQPDTIAMATYGSGLVSRVLALKKDHRDHFPAGWRVLVPWLGFLMVSLLLILFARLL